MCLSRSDQKQVLKKTKLSLKSISSFEEHEMIVASSDNENPISRRVDRLLQRKYGKYATELYALKENDFMEFYESAERSGEPYAALWATATHPSLSMKYKRKIFGKVHMGMHFSDEERMKMNRKLMGRDNELKEVRQSNKALSQKKRALEKKNQLLESNQAAMKASLDAANNEIEQLKQQLQKTDEQKKAVNSTQASLALKNELDKLTTVGQKQQIKIATLRKKNQRLCAQVSYLKDSNRQIRQETHNIVTEIVKKSQCDESCPSFDLCQKRILIVGGMSRMASLYREMIEASGGVFEYHDGYMKQGRRKLESRLRRADLVICPVNCNSHAACLMVKSLAKKHQKPVHILSNASLKAVSQAIWRKGDTPYVVN